MKTSQLKYGKDNPRKISDDKIQKLKKSIQEFPKMMELRPIIYDPETMAVLGGNMRLRAIKELGMMEIPDTWVRSAETLTEEEMQRFVITDNVGFGEWDYDLIRDEWNGLPLEDWGMELPKFAVSPDEFGDTFTLPEGDKEPFQQMTFTLADEQATIVKNAISDVKGTDEYKYGETFGNENSNGNAIFQIVSQWAGQRK